MELKGAGPFAGVTVVEFGQFVSVPFCGQMLADAGARVIKVEPSNGDPYRRTDPVAPGESRQFLTRNRGKESISLDLAHPDAAQVVRRLVAATDVVLVNMSPAATLRRGLDYDSLATVNPRLVYGAISAYGETGAESSLPGVDAVIQARSGLMTSLGALDEGVPRHSEVQVTDYASGMLLFGGIAAALYARTRSGVGQQVHVSLLGAALAIQNQSLSHVYGLDEWRHTFVEELPHLRSAGASADEVEARRRALRPDPPVNTAYYRVFATKDGAIAVGAASPLARDRLFAHTGVDLELLAADPAEVRRRLTDLFASRSCDEWITELRTIDVPVDRVRHFEELFFDSHAEAEGLVVDVEHHAVGKYRGLGSPIRMSGTPMAPGKGSPAFAADTAQVLAEIGFDEAERRALVRSGAVVAAVDGTEGLR